MAVRRGDADRSALALFADEMRAARDRAGLTQDELAARVNYSNTLIAMVQGLKRVPQADFAARLDDALGYPGTFARLQNRLRVLPFPASFRPFAGYEDLAVALRNFENTLVPGLLQTEAYARAVLSAGRTPARTRWTSWWRSGWPGRRSWTATGRPLCGWSSMRAC